MQQTLTQPRAGTFLSMRGFPLLNLLIALLLSGVVLLPLVYRATRLAPAPVEATGQSGELLDKGGQVSSHVRLRFGQPPASVRLKIGEAVLHEWTSPAATILEETLMMPFNDNRTEFTVQATWPAGTAETVIEITVEPDGKTARVVNVWASGAMADELVTLTWEGSTP